MSSPKITPKDFFLWAGAMVALYVSVTTFVSLLFSYLNYAYPDALQYYGSGDLYASGMSYQMATLIVLVPLFVTLMHFIRRSIASDPSRADVWVRRWALYLTLFVTAAAIAADLITLLMYFFNGDVTTRFVLKVAIVLAVSAVGFMHFLADLRGFWATHVRQARTVGAALIALVVLTIVSGFVIVGTPWNARLMHYDEQKINDLQQVQAAVTNYWQAKDALPSTLTTLPDVNAGYLSTTDAQTGAPYEYAATGPLSFTLCATFNKPSDAARGPQVRYPGPQAVSGSWEHAAGHVCFDRTIDPDFAPSYTK